jgi:hypothetical protein
MIFNRQQATSLVIVEIKAGNEMKTGNKLNLSKQNNSTSRNQLNYLV